MHRSSRTASALLLLVPFTLTAQDPAPAGEAAATKPAPLQVSMLRPTGSYADLAEAAFDPTSLLTGGGSPPKPFFELVTAIEGLAKVDGDTVMLDLSRPFGLNMPQLREVERALARVRGAGKRIVCYLENAGMPALQIAAHCDRVLLAEMGAVELKSPSLSVMHFKDALDLLGVQFDMTRVGEFKGAVEPYVLSEMSPALRAHYEAMLRSMNDDIVARIAAGRHLEPAVVRELQGKRLFSAKAAKDAGLVDELVPYDGAEHAIRRALSREDVELVDAAPKKKQRSRDLFAMLSEMFRPKREDEEIEEPEIVVLHLAGQISDGFQAQPGSIVSGPAVEAIDELTKNEHVVGVVVRVNSPGGSATASEAVRRALERLAAAKPVVYSMGNLAASGGYWITCIGRPIVAEATTITGSIGVFSLRMQAGALMRRLGVHNEVVGLDDGASFDAIDRPWSDSARSQMQGFVDEVYDRFIALASGSRKLEPDAVRAIAGGRVWSGTQAVERKLVDRIGGLDDAIAMVREQASAGADVEVRHYPRPKDFASTIVERMFESQVLAELEPRWLELARRGGSAQVITSLVRDAIAGTGNTTVYALLPVDLSVR